MMSKAAALKKAIKCRFGEVRSPHSGELVARINYLTLALPC